jgi:putative hydrolase of the HAD superfamily
MCDFAAVAFDIDGTLYPAWKLNLLAFPNVIRHCRFFLALGRVRKILHSHSRSDDFYSLQAELLARELGIAPDAAKPLIREIVYERCRKLFRRIKPFKGARETVFAFKAAGMKIGLLSDFPPEQKGDVWGIAPLCDAVISSEKIGALKPNPEPFDALADALGVPREKILYVGNSIRFDVRGARRAGLKTAYLLPFWKKILFKPPAEADFSFKTYRQLRDFVLK